MCKKCGCNTCDTKKPALMLNENLAPREILSEGLSYHLNANKPLTEHLYRAGSTKYFDLWAEARSYYSRGIIDITNEDDLSVLTETNLGHFGMFEGKKVPLDFPMLDEGTYEEGGEDEKFMPKNKFADGGGVYDKVNELRQGLLNYLKQQLPNTPEYVVKDMLYPSIKTANNAGEIDQEYIDQFKNIKWVVKTNFSITMDIFTDRTKQELESRIGGTIKKNIPNDAERLQLQKDKLKSQGISKEPIILFKTKDGKYDLAEGKHRTIEAFKMFPEGFIQPNVYIGLNAKWLDENLSKLKEAKNDNKPIGKPMRDTSGGKAYKVYVKDPKTGNIKTVRFGSGGLKAKINNPKARKAFAARHKCSTRNDKTKASYWSCRLPRYAKLLGLKSSFSGFW
jgi:hypothetical protein